MHLRSDEPPGSVGCKFAVLEHTVEVEPLGGRVYEATVPESLKYTLGSYLLAALEARVWQWVDDHDEIRRIFAIRRVENVLQGSRIHGPNLISDISFIDG